MSRCLVVDMASRADTIISELKQNGVTTVFRYYASGPQLSLPEKRLTAAESQALLNAGLSIGVVYQFNNNVLSSMTKGRGRDDAEFSLEHAGTAIGQPQGSAIYFGVDGDWFTAVDQKKVANYFDGVSEVFSAAGNPYRVGVYGSGTTCRNLKAASLAELFWLPLSTGWSGTRDFYNSGEWSFYQNFHGLRIGGRFTDTNVLNPVLKDIGTFNNTGVVSDVQQPSDIFDSRRFVKSSNTKLRSGAGTGFPAIKQLRKRQNLCVISEANGWCQVDIDESGNPDGFCQASELVSLQTMP